MKYEGLFEDFNNIRETQVYAVGTVIDEAQKYIEYLEGREEVLDGILQYLDFLDESGKNETKQEILEGIFKLLPQVIEED